MFDTGAELVEALGECDMGERNVEQLRVLSRAVLRKYKWLRNALRCAAAGSTALILVSLIVQARGHP